MVIEETQDSLLSRAERLRHRSAARREAQRGRLRELLLTVAEEHLLEKGYGAFSLREVAEATQYTPTTIYRHFRDREALIAAVLEKWFLLFARALDEADLPDAAPGERILAMGDAYLRFALAGEAGSYQPLEVAMMIWLGLHGTAAMGACSQIVDAHAAQELGMGIAHLLLRGLRSSA